jgi:nucleoside-diphosphate-sugar epimerase
MKSVLVTGSEGFLGRHLCRELKQMHYDVWKCDPKLPRDGFSFPEYVLRLYDVPSRFDIVVHLAATIESLDKRLAGGWEQYHDIALDLAMMDFVEKSKPETYVHLSSCALDYPDDPYCWVKMTGERLAKLLPDSVRVVILRPYSGYGPGQSLAYPFPAILDRAMRHEDPLKIWGSGKQIRDWVYVEDIIRVLVHVICEGTGDSREPLEVGTGLGTSIADLAFEIARACGYSPSLEPMLGKPTGSGRRVSLGWEWPGDPVKLEEGIRRSVEARKAGKWHKGA